VNTNSNAYIENRLAQEFVSVGQRAVVRAHESAYQPAYTPSHAGTNRVHRSRPELLNAQIDDGFRPFRVF
jgi:hypothetical protein